MLRLLLLGGAIRLLERLRRTGFRARESRRFGFRLRLPPRFRDRERRGLRRRSRALSLLSRLRDFSRLSWHLVAENFECEKALKAPTGSDFCASTRCQNRASDLKRRFSFLRSSRSLRRSWMSRGVNLKYLKVLCWLAGEFSATLRDSFKSSKHVCPSNRFKRVQQTTRSAVLCASTFAARLAFAPVNFSEDFVRRQGHLVLLFLSNQVFSLQKWWKIPFQKTAMQVSFSVTVWSSHFTDAACNGSCCGFCYLVAKKYPDTPR